MSHPAPDPVVLLASWMDWEKGDALPGKLISDLKRAGMRELLEELVRVQAEVAGSTDTGSTGSGVPGAGGSE